MITTRLIKITKLDDYNKLQSFIRKTHIDKESIEEIKSYIGLKCNRVHVEFPYADKDYLSTFYIHYSKKFKTFPKHCYRLHFFFDDYYYGFIVLRPTPYKKIGRTYLSPWLLLSDTSYIMTGKYKINFLGSETFISCFPWMHQETDISTCSHVAVWAILRYFGNKYKYYSDMTMGEVFEKVQLNYERKVPSKGLREEQISHLLTQFKFSTLIRKRDTISDSTRQYLVELLSYIESGLPLIAISSNMEHAVCVIGHGRIEKSVIDSNIITKYYEKVDFSSNNFNILLSSRLIHSVIVNDDNYFPYRTVNCNFLEGITAINAQDSTKPTYTIDAFDYFIIPLYEKMQLSYNEVYHKTINLIESKVLKYLPQTIVLRLFITSSNSFKEKAKNNKLLNIYLKKNILELNMPKFIWCVEISSISSYKNGLVDGLIIIDSTSSSKEDEPWLFMHDSKTLKYFNGNRLVYSNITGFQPYSLYKNNLEEYQF